MLDRIKIIMRIGHNVLDNEINNYIKSACSELIRVGVSEEKAKVDTTDILIQDAVITYVCMQLSVGKKDIYETYATSWEYQKDNLRKSQGYKAVIPDVQ